LQWGMLLPDVIPKTIFHMLIHSINPHSIRQKISMPPPCGVGIPVIQSRMLRSEDWLIVLPEILNERMLCMPWTKADGGFWPDIWILESAFAPRKRYLSNLHSDFRDCVSCLTLARLQASSLRSYLRLLRFAQL
jgi:hypothetical protein